MALSLGIDPLPYLRASGFETRVMDEVIQQAGELIAKRRSEEMQALQALVRNAVVLAFKR